MKQVIATAGKVEVVDVPRPVCPTNGVLVRTEYSVISTGTESWSIESTEPIGTSELARNSSLLGKAYKLSKEVLRQEGVAGLRNYVDTIKHPELPLGYSSSGAVLEVGRDVTDIIVGQKVACAGEGKASHSEFQSVPRKLLARVPNGLDMKAAAFSSVGSIALHAVRTAGLQIGENVAVIGIGLVGNLVAQLARAAGCRVACIDLRPDRLDSAKALGVQLVAKSDSPTLLSQILEFTDGVGVDHAFVCAATSSNEPINTAAKLTRSRGQVVVVGRVGMDVERKEFYQKELKLLMTRSLGPGRYDFSYEEKGVDYPIDYVRWTLNRNMEMFMELVKSGKVNVDILVGGEYPLVRAAEAFQSLESSSKMTALLRYDNAKVERPLPQAPLKVNVSKEKGVFNVALVGPGAFAKETLIPLLRSNREFNLKWFVSSTPTSARQLERRYKGARGTCDYNEVLSDDEVDLVVITAPNNFHSEMLLSSMRAGKHALVEKPLCITTDEFEKIKEAQSRTKLPIIVGFNRRYAPLVLAMKKKMNEIGGPFVINYRVNAGFVPASKWSQDPNRGGGRIIHECCHFFDLFNFLLGPGEPRISVEVAGITGVKTVAQDNVSVSLRYPDGSLANLLYVAMGSKAMDRERIEVYADKTSMVLDDFKELATYSESIERIKLPRGDKGHNAELEQIARLLGGKESSVISTEEVFRATDLTFKVDEAARGRTRPLHETGLLPEKLSTSESQPKTSFVH